MIHWLYYAIKLMGLRVRIQHDDPKNFFSLFSFLYFGQKSIKMLGTFLIVLSLPHHGMMFTPHLTFRRQRLEISTSLCFLENNFIKRFDMRVSKLSMFALLRLFQKTWTLTFILFAWIRYCFYREAVQREVKWRLKKCFHHYFHGGSIIQLFSRLTADS